MMTKKMLTPILVAGAILAPALALAAPPAPPARPNIDCGRLANRAIAAAAIGLPTRGGAVTATQVTPASGAGASAVGEYCLVSGNILPIDPKAPNIQFQLALPAAWNGKAVMLGGGGYDGTIPKVAGAPLNTPATSPTPLARGYAVFASDSGHQGQGADGAFLANDEAYRNWMGEALKKTRDAALVLIEARYGAAPTRSYFLGSSTGGREALAVAARWPADWDGVVALYPGRNATIQILGMLATTQAFAAPGAWPDAAKRGVLYRAALSACDGLDGVNDGLISNVRACNARFDPATALLNGVPVRCPGGVDTGDSCLSDAQLIAIKKMNHPTPFNFPLASGQTSFPGYNILTSDSGAARNSPLAPLLSLLAMGATPPSFPLAPGNALAASLTQDFIRLVVTGDPTFNQLTFDVTNPGRFAPRLTQLSAQDVADNDLSAFAARGGKALIMQGTADLLVSPRGTEDYYEQLRTKMGASKLDSFLRYYEIPGFGHSISADFNATWDQLTALENWVEKDADPTADQIVTDTTGVPGRTRPLCRYPTWPKYKGAGDIDRAASFICAAD